MDAGIGIALAVAVVVIVAGAILFLRQMETDKTVSASEDRLRSALESLQSNLINVTTSNQESLSASEGRLRTALEALQSNLTQVATSNQQSLVNVTEHLGALSQSTAGLREETEKLGELREAFRAPGPRGGFGELLLENALRDVLSADQYTIQHSFADGSRVDAVVKIGERLVPIDSKFPTAAFDELAAATNEDDRRRARRTFLRAVRGHVNAVAGYIKPDEDTVDYALMYVPAENVFQQIVIRERGDDAGSAPVDHAQSRGVIITSPNTLYLYLQTIATALRGFAIEQHAREIGDQVSRLARDLGGVLSDYAVLGRHLNNARSKYDEIDRDLDRFRERLSAAGQVTDGREAGED